MPQASTLPVDPRILQDARHAVIDNCRQALLGPQPVIKRQLALDHGRLVGAARAFAGAFGRFFRTFLAGPFAGAGQLLLFGHALAGALIGFATAGSEEVLVLSGLFAATPARCADRDEQHDAD